MSGTAGSGLAVWVTLTASWLPSVCRTASGSGSSLDGGGEVDSGGESGIPGAVGPEPTRITGACSAMNRLIHSNNRTCAYRSTLPPGELRSNVKASRTDTVQRQVRQRRLKALPVANGPCYVPLRWRGTWIPPRRLFVKTAASRTAIRTGLCAPLEAALRLCGLLYLTGGSGAAERPR